MTHLARYAFGISAAAALLAGCGGSQLSAVAQSGSAPNAAGTSERRAIGITWVSQQASIEEGSTASIRAVCPSGDVVSGGGYYITPEAGITSSLIASQPYQTQGSTGLENAWSMTASIGAGNHAKVPVVVYAGCLSRS